MQIAPPTVPPTGRMIAIDDDQNWAIAALGNGFSSQMKQCRGVVHVHVDENRFRVKLSIEAEAFRPCDRCGDEISLKVILKELLCYDPEVPMVADPLSKISDLDDILEEVALSNEDLNLGWYRDGRLDLAVVLEEAASIYMPNRLFCDHPDVTRGSPGKCKTLKKDDVPHTHKPFADLSFFE